MEKVMMMMKMQYLSVLINVQGVNVGSWCRRRRSRRTTVDTAGRTRNAGVTIIFGNPAAARNVWTCTATRCIAASVGRSARRDTDVTKASAKSCQNQRDAGCTPSARRVPPAAITINV